MSWAAPSNRDPMQCAIAIDVSGPALGYCVRYPTGTVLHGQFDDDVRFLDAVAALLQNGLPWRVLLATPGDDRVSGALWYLAAKHGANFTETPLPQVTDGQLSKQLLWRRGLSAANRAARLLWEAQP